MSISPSLAIKQRRSDIERTLNVTQHLSLFILVFNCSQAVPFTFTFGQNLAEALI